MFDAKRWMVMWLRAPFEIRGCPGCFNQHELSAIRNSLVRLGKAYARGVGGRVLSGVHDMWRWVDALSHAVLLVRPRHKCACLRGVVQGADETLALEDSLPCLLGALRVSDTAGAPRITPGIADSPYDADTESSNPPRGEPETLLQRLEAPECVHPSVNCVYRD